MEATSSQHQQLIACPRQRTKKRSDVTCPSKAWIALEASSGELNVTKPNPLDRPVSRSTITLAEMRKMLISISAEMAQITLNCNFMITTVLGGREIKTQPLYSLSHPLFPQCNYATYRHNQLIKQYSLTMNFNCIIQKISSLHPFNKILKLAPINQTMFVNHKLQLLNSKKFIHSIHPIKILKLV